MEPVVEILPTGAALGAEVRGVDIRASLDAATVRQLIDAWHQHLILIIREQPMTDEQHIAFTRCFGELEYPGITKLRKKMGDKAPAGIEIRPDSPIVVSNIMHKREAFDPGARRRMHRTQTVGTRPF